MLIIDHLGLIQGHPAELKKFRNLLLAAEAGRLLEASIMHESDDSCCAREPWVQTFDRVAAALRCQHNILHLTIGDAP